MIIKVFHTGILQVNTYLLIDEKTKEAVIIDLGGDFERINQVIKENDANLKFIINTHGHFDHIMGDLAVQEAEVTVPVYMHIGDQWHADHIGASLKRWGVMDDHPPIKIAEYIDENKKLQIGDIPIKIIHTPGHSQGGLCYLIENNLFSGDTLFNESIGRTDFEDGDYDTLIKSIKEKLLPLDESTIVYPGHGPSTTIEHEKKHNSFLK